MDWNKKVGLKDCLNFFKGIFKRVGFTPRKKVSRIDHAFFDTGQWDAYSEPANYLDDDDKWAMRNYDLAERTGLWSTNMSDGPVIDGEVLPKIDFERDRF